MLTVKFLSRARTRTAIGRATAAHRSSYMRDQCELGDPCRPRAAQDMRNVNHSRCGTSLIQLKTHHATFRSEAGSR
jgi:hypothetical protein